MRNILLLLALAAACFGCGDHHAESSDDCNVPPPQEVSPDVACKIIQAASALQLPECQTLCNYNECTLPSSYVNEFVATHACPAVDAPVEVTCEDSCF